MYITNDIKYVGVNDHNIDLFEGQYKVPNGMAYNSYVIMDEKVAIMDTVDVNFGTEWLINIEKVLNGRQPDYLIVQHMEPDHSANIANFMDVYKDAKIVSSQKAFGMMKKFFGTNFANRQLVIENGSTLRLGAHTLAFVEAPMVHWPEVVVTYDILDKVLFSADGVGKFGANDVKEEWADEARRYYIGIVGMYGNYVQDLLKVAGSLDIQVICPLHGPVLRENLGYYLALYDKWSSYTPEEEGIVVAYTSVYGHTREAALALAQKLRDKKAPKVVVYDLARDDMSAAVSDAFRYSKLVLATTTYNGSMYPFMHDYIHRLVEHKYQKRTVALIENGSWAPQAYKLMKQMLSECENISFTENNVHIHSALDEKNYEELEMVSYELCKEYLDAANSKDGAGKTDPLYTSGYGIYAVTARDGEKDAGCTCNSVMYNEDGLMEVTINKISYTHDVILATRKLNLGRLTVNAPYDLLKTFGQKTGRKVDKFAQWPVKRADNGIVYLGSYLNALVMLEVTATEDLGSYTRFICKVVDSCTISMDETLTYPYYQEHIKPAPAEGEAGKPAGYVCEICGYIYEDDELPPGFTCPICKAPASKFKPL